MVERPRFPTIIGEMNNMDLRVKYMIGEVTDMQFKHILQKREKSNQKKREIGLIKSDGTIRFSTRQTCGKNIIVICISNLLTK